MKTLICPYCGCSLVRLQIPRDKAAPYSYAGTELYFCCQACADLFAADPEEHLERTKDVAVCPTCLGEKPPAAVFTFEHAGQEVPYCGCPYCQEQVLSTWAPGDDSNRYILGLREIRPLHLVVVLGHSCSS